MAKRGDSLCWPSLTLSLHRNYNKKCCNRALLSWRLEQPGQNSPRNTTAGTQLYTSVPFKQEGHYTNACGSSEAIVHILVLLTALCRQSALSSEFLFTFGMIDFLCSDNCFYTMKTIERYISIWMLCQIYPVACGMLSVWWEAKTFSVREKRTKLYLIWVLIWVPQAYPAAVSVSIEATLDMPFQWDHCKMKLLLNYILLSFELSKKYENWC